MKLPKKLIAYGMLFEGYFIADCTTTWLGMSQGIRESNPVLNVVFGVFGIYIGLLLVKTIIAGIVIGLSMSLKKYSRAWSPEVFAAMLGVEGYIVSVWNTLLITGTLESVH